ncbi:MAG: hypothetical protein ABWY56_09820 [Propionibacteriaceae bacterium]
MSRLPRPLALIILSAVGLSTLLSACTSAPTDPVAASPSASASSSSPSTGTPSTGSPSTSTPSTGTDTPTSSEPAADAVTVDITIKGDQVTPNGDKVDVAKGQTVVLNVTSDIDDEIHAHTSGDGYELEVKAGKTVTGEFVAADTGTFEVESHHLEKVIVRLVVR